MKSKLLLTPLALLGSASLVSAASYHITVVASGLHWHRGIVALDADIVFFSQLPSPGVPRSIGGSNTVNALDVPGGEMLTIATGEPEPTFLALNKQHRLYWTCKSAGVILTTDFRNGISTLLSDLNHPSGIAVDRWNNVYFTTLPTPGLAASKG